MPRRWGVPPLPFLKPISNCWTAGPWRSLLALVLVLVLAMGCSPQQFVRADRQVPQLVFSLSSDPKTFNPPLNREYPNIFLYTFRGLTKTDGLTGEVVPSLAESWDIAADGQTVVFTLRENLRWSDGEPLTADDVSFTFNEVLFNPAIPTSGRDVLSIGTEGLLPEVEALDERRVEFRLPEPFAPLLRTLELEILPAHALRDVLQETDAEGNSRYLSTWGTDTDPAEIICNGPFRLKEYVPAEQIVFERNPYFWREDDQGNPQPHIERIVWRIVPSTDAAMLQFRSGNLDLIGVPPRDFSLLKREEERGDFTIYNGGPALGTSFVLFNLNQASRNGSPLVDPVRAAWFNTLAFRQAVAYGIDRQTMINNIFQGLGEPQTSPVSVQSPYFVPPEEGIPTYPYDPEKAKTLLLEGGFRYNANDELEDSNGNRVRFTLNASAGSPTSQTIGAQIEQDLGRLGIQVDFQPLGFNAIVDRLSNSLEWEAIILGLTGGLDPNGGANVWALDGSLHMFNQNALPGSDPIEGWQAADWEQRIAKLYIEGARTIDEAERRQIYKETQRLTQTYLPFIYLVNSLNMGAIRNRVENVRYSGLVQPPATWNIHELTLRPD